MFLRKLEGSLTRISMNGSFPKLNLEEISVFKFCKLTFLDDLSLRNVGLLHIKGIAECFPNLSILDVANNKIFSVDDIEELHKLDELTEVSFKENPVCVHKHLTDMVQDVVPNIEVVNHTTLKEAGHRYKEELANLRHQIAKIGNTQVGSSAGDRIIADAEADPDF